MFQTIKKNLPFLISVVSGLVLVFLTGVLFGHLKLPPQPTIQRIAKAYKDLKQHGESYYLDKPTRHLATLRFQQTGVVLSDTKNMQPGVTFITGLFGNKLGARLLAHDGSIIHEWPVDFFQLDTSVMRYKFDALLHGAALYPNGDFVANFDGQGMVRISACGDIIWRNKERTHHSIFIDDAGDIWAPKFKKERYNDKTVLSGSFVFDQVGRFDPKTGKLLTEIDLVASMVRAGAQGLVRINRVRAGDMFHLNDVEILSATMAEQFPLFTAGDIMLSSRNYNQIWILDGHTHDLKWWMTGPMIGQHDPDFQADGSITVFDNQTSVGGSPANHYLGNLGGSRILRIDPTTRRYTTVFSSNQYTNFYTAYRGKHEVLDNGNLLLIETNAGRVLEVLPNGKPVWSYINAWDEDEVGWVMGAYRYPESYSSIADIDCKPKQQNKTASSL